VGDSAGGCGYVFVSFFPQELLCEQTCPSHELLSVSVIRHLPLVFTHNLSIVLVEATPPNTGHNSHFIYGNLVWLHGVRREMGKGLCVETSLNLVMVIRLKWCMHFYF